jgi:hypothetical protein
MTLSRKDAIDNSIVQTESMKEDAFEDVNPRSLVQVALGATTWKRDAMGFLTVRITPMRRTARWRLAV